MGIEIERKFLLADDGWKEEIIDQHRIRQAYLVSSFRDDARSSVRIRIQGDTANINIKSAELGVHRQEYEYDIPLADAEAMLDELGYQPMIEKTRYLVEHAGMRWEIDEFYGANEGLLVAELELERIDQAWEKPAWLGQDVSDDPRYYNVNLIQNPYRNW